MNTLATKMKCWHLSEWWLLVMIASLMIPSTEGVCIDEERRALLDIKFSYINSYDSKREDLLPTWIDYRSGSECCDWERVKCNTTTGHVTELSLSFLSNSTSNDQFERITADKFWPLNVSLFLHFEELTSLDLSNNFLDGRIMKTELKRLSSLKKLEMLDLSSNSDIDNGTLPSLSALTSLISLRLSETNMRGYFPANELAALKNLESLDLSFCGLYGTFQIQGSERVPVLRKLESLKLRGNNFNNSLIRSLSILPSLKVLDLYYNPISQPFPAQELSRLTSLEELNIGSMLDYSYVPFPSPGHACKSLSRLIRLKSLDLSFNYFDKSIISCLSALPSLRILDMSASDLGSYFLVQEFRDLPNLEVLLLIDNRFSGTIPMEAFASFRHLEVLDLSSNNFVGSIPSAIQALTSLRAVSFAFNKLNGSLPDHGLCELKNLRELDLRNNTLDGILPQCFNNLSSLELFDISLNRFTGILRPSLIANLTFLKYIDLSHNKFEGSFSFNSFSNHTKLIVVAFRSDNDKFEVETEGPIDWIPRFQLEFLELSNCNINSRKGHVVPGFLVYQHKLRVVAMNDNSLEGNFPNWLLENNTNMEILLLRNNSFGVTPLYRSVNLVELDISGNHMIGPILEDIQKAFPNIYSLNLSRNALSGAIPSSFCNLIALRVLDLSDNELSGEVPNGLFTNLSQLTILRLSKNQLYGQVLSGNISLRDIERIHLDNNLFTGKIGTKSEDNLKFLGVLDISNNMFEGMIPGWISNMNDLSELVVRNNSFKGRFPCGATPFSFLDISQNSFFGPIPSCLNLQYMKHLHLGSNRFTGSIPNFFRNLTNVLTLDIGNNNLSGRIPGFLGELSNIRILVLRKNNFNGFIPKQLCQLSNVSLIDLSGNFLSGSIPGCLQNIIGPSYLAIVRRSISSDSIDTNYEYESVLGWTVAINFNNEAFETQNEVQFTTKSLSLPYKGDVLYYMRGLDLSCNKLTGQIPKELSTLSQIHALNLSHNQLTGPIPVSFSNLTNMESLDLSSNGLTGKVPSNLIQLSFLSFFNVSHNNLSGRLPEMKGQFGTFTNASYEGNPLLCGPPLGKKCTPESHITDPSPEEEEEEEGTEKWYDMDMACFYASSSSACVVFLLGFVTILYINPHWRRRWLGWVEECIYTCYDFLHDSLRKPYL